MRRNPDNRLRTGDRSSGFHVEIILADVNTGRPRQPGEIRTIVDDDSGVERKRVAHDRLGEREEVGARPSLPADLHEGGAAAQTGTGDGCGFEPARRAGGIVNDGVENGDLAWVGSSESAM